MKERFAGSGSTPVSQMLPDTGTGCTWEANSSIKFNACVDRSGEAVSMEHLPAPPLCLYQKNQSHVGVVFFFFCGMASSNSLSFCKNGREVCRGSFSQNKR